MGIKIILTILSALVTVAMGDLSETQILQSNGVFTKKLYSILAQKPGNIFFSPISAHAVLSMSYLGAEGATKEAYVKSLGLQDKESVANGYQQVSAKLNNAPDVTLYWANKVYVTNKGQLKETFAKAVVEKFASEVQSVDFSKPQESASEINSWVEKKTVDKIKNLIKPDDIDPVNTRLILVNAIYFKGNWLNKFKKSATRTEPFYLNANDKIDVQMMHATEDYNYKHDDSLKAKILEMPYANTDFSLVLILPDEKDGIKDLESKLENVDLTKITDGAVSVSVTVAIPKFKIETTIPLNEALNQIGLGKIFSNGAEFGGMLDNNEPLTVSKVIQKAFIEVNEEGTEAAAATGLIFNSLSMPRRRYFLADHPFIFMLQKSSSILFAGKCTQPVSGDNNVAPKGVPIQDPLAKNIYISLA